MQLEKIDIQTHSGFKADEHPVGFTWRGRHYRVASILDRWYEGGMKRGDPQLNYFKVRADDGAAYLLRHNALFDAWAIVLPDEPPCKNPPP